MLLRSAVAGSPLLFNIVLLSHATTLAARFCSVVYASGFWIAHINPKRVADRGIFLRSACKRATVTIQPACNLAHINSGILRAEYADFSNQSYVIHVANA